jgi:hypothetical protein
MNTAKVIILINLLICILLVFWYPHLMISPGNLLEGHQELTTDCFSCHRSFLGISDEKCIACHAVKDIGLVTTKGEIIQNETKVSFHQHLKQPNCVACHTDHQGMKVYRSFQQFSHQLLTLQVKDNCDTCHQKPTDSLHEKITGSCDQCHRETRWKPAKFVDHDQYFRFDRHHKTECVTCHLNNDYQQYSCYECHEHSPSNIREEHLEEGIHDYQNCTECHRSGDEEEAERLWQSKRHSSVKNQQFDRNREHHDHEDDHEDDHDDDHDDD